MTWEPVLVVDLASDAGPKGAAVLNMARAVLVRLPCPTAALGAALASPAAAELVDHFDVVVADELRGANGPFRCQHAPELAAALERAGVRSRSGPIVSMPRAVRGRERARLAGVCDPDVEIGIAKLELKRGKVEAAKEALRGALELFPRSARALEALGGDAPAQ